MKLQTSFHSPVRVISQCCVCQKVQTPEGWRHLSQYSAVEWVEASVREGYCPFHAAVTQMSRTLRLSVAVPVAA
jgi:hypothetical protein